MSKAMSGYTTFGIGGEAKRLVVCESEDILTDLAPGSLVLGGGSKVLVSDAGYDGTVIINRCQSVTIVGNTAITGSGVRLPQLCARLLYEALSGMEWACGIPGTVGGAVRMNAGAFGGSISDVLLYADVLRDGRVVRLSREELRFSYRQSGLSPCDTVLRAAFALEHRDKREIADRLRAVTKKRRALQPAGRSAGSVFRNPPGVSIAKLIDGAGLKGYAVGGAKISEKHANFIINTGGATASDVCRIINKVKCELAPLGVEAREELIYIGDFE